MNLRDELRKITKIREDFDIGKTGWMGCSATAEILAIPHTIEELEMVVKFLNSINIKPNIIGARSNTIIRRGGLKGVTIWLKSGDFIKIEKLESDKVFVGAGVLDFTFANYCRDNSIAGMEFLIGIPGTIGGNIAMNAGCYGGEIKDRLVSLRYIDNLGFLQEVMASDLTFEYRKTHLPDGAIVVDAVFQGGVDGHQAINNRMLEIEEKRKKTQPIGRKTVGSTFKNPKLFTKSSFEKLCNHFNQNFEHRVIAEDRVFCDKIHSWMLIDAVGLRNVLLNGAKFSEIHSNFLINENQATAGDLEDLINLAIEKVDNLFRVKLAVEVKIVGEDMR